MNIVVDHGNTTTKLAIFENDRLAERHVFSLYDELKAFLATHPADNIIVSSVGISAEDILAVSRATVKIALTHTTPIPVKNLYATPETLGVDRIAAVCGAFELFPGKDCLVIDAGTCITYELLDGNGAYHGGGISPGIHMRFEAMNGFTSRLPLVNPANDVRLIGNTTERCMQSGVMVGVRAEADGIIQRYTELYPDIHVLLCGGDAGFFENQLEATIFAEPDLVLMGLNCILKHSATH